MTTEENGEILKGNNTKKVISKFCLLIFVPLENLTCTRQIERSSAKGKRDNGQKIRIYSSTQVSQDNCQLKPKKQYSPGKKQTKNPESPQFNILTIQNKI